MRTFLLRAATVLAMLSLASPALATSSDATFDTNVTLSVGGVSIAVTGVGINAESITVNSGNFTLTMPSGSELHISAASLNKLNVSASTGLAFTNTCTSGGSSVDLSATVDVNVTVTPGVDLCGASSSSSSGSGSNGPVASSGGGGGGGSSNSSSLPTYSSNAPTLPAAATENKNPVAAAAHFKALVRALKKGNTGADVKVLQQMLNQDKDTQVSLSGVGSPGKETTLFGNATLAAIKKFQVKWGIAKIGDSGYGNLGPKTRAKLNALYAR